MLKKIAIWIYKKIILSDFVVYNGLFLSGAIIFSALIGNNIGGKYRVLLLVFSYLILGIGLYGIFKWLAINGIRLFIFLIKLILFGNIEVTITNGKVDLKTYFKR